MRTTINLLRQAEILAIDHGAGNLADDFGQEADRLERAEPAAHVFPDDMKRLAETECTADCYSIAMGHPEKGLTVPLYRHPPAAQPEQEKNRIRAEVVREAKRRFVTYVRESGKHLSADSMASWFDAFADKIEKGEI